MYVIGFYVHTVTYRVTTRRRVSKLYLILYMYNKSLNYSLHLNTCRLSVSSAAALSIATSPPPALPPPLQFNWRSPRFEPLPPA